MQQRRISAPVSSQLAGPGPAASSAKDVASAGLGKGDDVDKSRAKLNPLTYPKSDEPFNEELFRNPTAEYRGCPFWAWNTKLNKEQLRRQIDVFEAMGLGGFHIHSRVGLDTEYLGAEFLNLVEFCVDYAESKGMLAALYDEDKWPSGTVGGRLTEQYPEHLAKHLLLTPNFKDDTPQHYLVARYSIRLDDSGCLASATVLDRDQNPADGGDLWYAYVENIGIFGYRYVDTMSRPAIKQFIKMTHERYKAKVGNRFGSTIPCIFTDEPQFFLKRMLPDPASKSDVHLPWTTDFPLSFKQEYGPQADILRDLPQVVWNLPSGKPSAARWQFHDHTCERFVSAFTDQIGAWCAKNNLMLDGHMQMEDTLWSQTAAIGEAMRCYRGQQIPGMDLLFDDREFNTAKQVSSVARQKGRRAAMSELYGVTHWTFTFEGHKGCGDWQAALGITFRVQHLAWVSMAGEGKRDYPASIGYQSPWCLEYSYIEDHFARVAMALTRGRSVTRVAVFHPLESYWLSYGPESSNGEARWRDQAFRELTDWLLFGLVDFDFVSEGLLPSQFRGTHGKKLHVGECAYDVVILPNLRTLRSTSRAILGQFAQAGGKIFVAGQHPEFVDAQIPERPLRIELSRSLQWDRNVILAALDHYRDIRIISSEGSPAHESSNLLYQMREDGAERFVFICNIDRNSLFSGHVQLKGAWDVQVLDTLAGKQHTQRATQVGGWTTFPYKFDGCASLLLRLKPADLISHVNLLTVQSPSRCKNPTETQVQMGDINFSEPNVLMLDIADYNIQGQGWQGPQEILQIDNDVRARLSLPQKSGGYKQPWTIPQSKRKPVSDVHLRFHYEIIGDIPSHAYLAIEIPEDSEIKNNGVLLNLSVGANEWWVDEDITKVPIPARSMKVGVNTLTMQVPFGILTNLERLYILGDFSVKLDGTKAVMQNMDMSRVGWGDITTMGLPFYAGNVSYEFILVVDKQSKAVLSVPEFSSPVLAVDQLVQGGWKRRGRIAFQPRQLNLGILEAGVYTYRITAFGNRYNAFGHLHLPDGSRDCNPDMWRTKSRAWTDEYRIKPIGVLKAPTVLLTELDDLRLETEQVDETPAEPGQQDGCSPMSAQSSPESPGWVIIDCDTIDHF
ncbi:hypothetical protein GQ53DRAFT_731961 [Thozetella sp. PMI_491]|nr:hypothetical protein GQ53DRAFT_731961 [Thozetella sp. PMI_491]